MRQLILNLIQIFIYNSINTKILKKKILNIREHFTVNALSQPHRQNPLSLRSLGEQGFGRLQYPPTSLRSVAGTIYWVGSQWLEHVVWVSQSRKLNVEIDSWIRRQQLQTK